MAFPITSTLRRNSLVTGFLILSCVLNIDLFTSEIHVNSEGMKGKQPSRSSLVQFPACDRSCDPVEVFCCSLNCALNIDLLVTTEINYQLLLSSL